MDSLDTIDTSELSQAKAPARPSRQRGFWHLPASWLTLWELYPLIAVTTFLHFYQLSLTEFDADQVIFFRLAHEAVVHGLIPANGTVASIGIVDPPGYVYLLVLVAAFTANPLTGVILTALFNVVAVLLTYGFTRRYYGRLAGTVAALLYTTTFWDVFFGRFIWQPNVLPFFTLLFLFALFRGVVEHKTGWFAAALPLLGFMLQLHATPIYMAIPLALALVLAYKTVRWLDVLTGLFLFFFLFLPYIIWEASTNFVDIPILLGASSHSSHLDTQALVYYADFLLPYVGVPGNPHSMLLHFIPLLRWERWAMYAVTLGGFLVAILGLFGWKHVQLMSRSRFPDAQIDLATETPLSPWQRFWKWWQAFAASPQRSGLLLLLSWQLPPLLFMSRHTIALQPQYFLILLPGPFILIGLLVSQLRAWSRQAQELTWLLRFVVPALSLLLVLLQFTGSLAWYLDEAHGNNYHGHDYNTVQDLQNAVDAADQLAQYRHLHHVYIDTDTYTLEAFKYLAEQMQTSATVLSSSNCLVLPALSQGPAVLLLGPADTLDEALLNHFTSATLVSSPSRLGGSPFRLYILQPLPATPDSQASFTHTLTLNTSRPGAFTWSNPDHPNWPATHLFETVWTNLSTLPTAYGTMYTYHFTAQYSGKGTDGQTGSADCGFTSLTPGEQLLVPFKLPTGSTTLPSSLTLSGSTWISQPYELHHGPFSFESILSQHTLLATFQSTSGGNSLTVQSAIEP